jgi:hypothetical protein
MRAASATTAMRINLKVNTRLRSSSRCKGRRGSRLPTVGFAIFVCVYGVLPERRMYARFREICGVSAHYVR